MREDDGAISAPVASSQSGARESLGNDRASASSLTSASGEDLAQLPRSRRWHASSVVIFVLGLAITLALALVAQVDANDAAARLLDLQLRQIATAVEASVPQFQQPLIAAAQYATATKSPQAFETFVRSEVGPGAPFRSVLLWQVGASGPHLLASVGRSAILGDPRLVRHFLSGIRPSTQLWVTGIFQGPPRGYGIAEVLPGTTGSLVVYAEPALLPVSSQVAGLDIELYLGRRAAPRDLMTSGVPTSAPGPQASAVVSFGTSVITVVVRSSQPLASALSRNLPWLIGVLGLLLVLTSTYANERLVRRRELADLNASSTEQRFVAQRAISTSLQQALLPEEHPTFPGLDLATRYVAGTRGLEIGGDWFETIAIDEERMFVAVGDVSGRGLKAATTMTYLRHAIRAYAIQGDGPDVVLGKLDELLDVERDECFATVLCGLLEVTSRRVIFASAGHPPPLIIDGSGARYAELTVGPPIGAGTGANPPARVIDLAPEAAVVAFTDGLVERRDAALDARLETLRTTAAALRGPMESSLTSILASLVADGSDDDIAILGVKWRT